MSLRKTFANAYLRLRHNVGSKALLPKEQDSECVSSLEYDVERQQMTVHFTKRGSYVFFDIEPWLFSEFNSAASRGTYFNLYIRPQYTNFERIA